MSDALTFSIHRTWTLSRAEVERYVREDTKQWDYELPDDTWEAMKAWGDYDCWGCEAYLLGSFESDVDLALHVKCTDR